MEPSSPTAAAAPAPVASGTSNTARLHTIVLAQPSKHDSTRFYQDYTSKQEALEGILRSYETRLKEQHPGTKTLMYDFNSLCQYVDDLRELCLLSWDESILGYKRYDKEWAKSALQELLASFAPPGPTKTSLAPGGGSAAAPRQSPAQAQKA
ncbi:enhancer of rudimentary-domain-containing protein [Haematococcus lacustris]